MASSYMPQQSMLLTSTNHPVDRPLQVEPNEGCASRSQNNDGRKLCNESFTVPMTGLSQL